VNQLIHKEQLSEKAGHLTTRLWRKTTLLSICVAGRTPDESLWTHKKHKQEQNQQADLAISTIAKLYAVEKETRNSDAAARHAIRQAHSVPALEQLRA
jgi:hypothetical protein